MEPITKKLRPYQVRLVTDVCRVAEDVLVEQPTGSGKTVQIVILVAMHLGERFTHAVISAPQEQIEQGFVKRDYQTIAFPDCRGVAVPPIQASKALIKGARESRLGSIKRVIHYLRQPGPLDHAFACTHAALNRLTPEQLPEDLSGKALFIDEAHHASADGLSQIVALWRERGGQLFFFTATPYRGDGRPVRLEGMRAYRRSLAEHMAEGFAPRHLESEIVALGQPGDAITAGQFTGEEAPPSSYSEGLIAAICRRWVEDGKPKAIVRVPPMRGGRSGELVSRLMQALAAEGARVLDATGTGTADKHRFLTGLEAEKNRTHASSAFDVVVGIQRVLEGTDWPVCSAVYCVGMPGSLNTVVQFLGRAMRLKGDDYPAAQRDRARLVFFVPCGGGAALADLSLDHSRHALLTCCFLADHEVGQEWIVLREVRRGIEAALGAPTEHSAAADAENEADEPLDPEIRAEVEFAITCAREQLLRSGGEPTAGEVVEVAAKTWPDLPATALQRVAAEILAAETTSDGAAVRKAIQREIATRLRIDPRVKQAMAAAFAVVLEEFRDVTIKDSVVLESVGRQVHGVTGGQMREFAQRLHDANPRPLTLEWICERVRFHHGQTGDWPKRDSGSVLDAPGETWLRIHKALQDGLRSLQGNSSLPQLLEEHFGVRNHLHLPPLTIKWICDRVKVHRERTGKWPKQKSGPVLDVPGETWLGIDAALRIGLRELPGSSSLARLLNEQFDVRHLFDLPPLSTETILVWAKAYFDANGNWPNHLSGPIDGVPGETWSGVVQALRKGRRGLTRGITLADLLEQHFRVSNQKNRPDLSLEWVYDRIHSHHEGTGEWPTRDSGAVLDAPKETWASIDSALREGLRNLPSGSSLPRFLEENFGVRNSRNPPPLSEEWVCERIRFHYDNKGKWPRRDSGILLDAPGETWLGIDKALRKGNRNLPSSSLPRFLEDNFGVRNAGNLPLLTVDWIVERVKFHTQCTDKWPKHKSGAILDAPDETWLGIDKALRDGNRGLPGGSSLARFLEQHFSVRNHLNLPALTLEWIRDRVQFHFDQTGKWPTANDGEVIDAPDETWRNIDAALKNGYRTLPGSSSLARQINELRMAGKREI